MAIEVGILGFAHGHVMAFGGNWQKHPEMGVHIAMGWDADYERAQKSAETLGTVAVKTADEILDNPDIQAVVITSETKYHTELAIRAAKAKKAIIMYKPMALTLKEADEIVAAVEENKVPFTMGYQMRVDPQNIKIKELIKDKAIGETYVYRRRHALSTHTWDNFQDTWHANAELNREIGRAHV